MEVVCQYNGDFLTSVCVCVRVSEKERVLEMFPLCRGLNPLILPGCLSFFEQPLIIIYLTVQFQS